MQKDIVDEILRRHLAEGDEELISAKKVARYVTSPFALYCDMFAPEDERDPDSEFLVMRRERGNVYEKELIEGETTTISYETLEEGFRLTVEMMAAGHPAIYQAMLISKPEGMIGVPDQLLIVPNSKSIFGKYRYRVVEVKSFFNIKESDRAQAAFYNRLLGLIQDLTPRTFTIINGRGEQTLEEFARWEWDLDKYMEEARDVIAGDRKPEPVFGETPEPWRAFGDKEASSGLTSLWQIGYSRREELNKAGYYTVEDIARARECDLSAVPKLDSYVAGCIVPQAKAILENAPVWKKPVRFPEARAEMFLDMENINEGTDVLEGTRHGFVNYLIGTSVRSESEERYTWFFAETPDEEEERWREFCDFVASHSASIYYWGASAEKVYIRKLMYKYGAAQDVRDKLDGSIDLNRLVVDSVAFPVEGYNLTSKGYGLKDIAGHLGFQWSQRGHDGLWAMTQYKKYLKSHDRRIRKELLTYNEDDCRAAMFVKDWLVANSS